MEPRPPILRERRGAGDVPAEAAGEMDRDEVLESNFRTRNVGRPMAKNGV